MSTSSDEMVCTESCLPVAEISPVAAPPFKSFQDLLPAARRRSYGARPVVCIQGLGFVGAAMAAAVASARTADAAPRFNVIGVDLDTPRGQHAIDRLGAGQFPFATTDPTLEAAVAEGCTTGNLVATCAPAAYGLADVIVVDVNLDLDLSVLDRPDGRVVPKLDLSDFRQAIQTLGRWMRPDALIIVETTVPPGTCARVIAPELRSALQARGLAADRFRLAHSYERVMPGADYLSSIVNYWRVYAGHTEDAAAACAAFLSQVVNVSQYPLRRLSSTTASETAKVLENSYRAVNIAFMEEWGRFGERAGIDIFEVVDAIRVRPTHSNIRQPGFGVGGYCLPKDPLMALAAAQEIFGFDDLDFPFCREAAAVNRTMPLVSLDQVQGLMGGTLRDLRLALLGVSYRPDVADTRYAPAEVFVREARRRGAEVVLHDPLADFWPELGCEVSQVLPDPHGLDAVVFATAHDDYRDIVPQEWLDGAQPAIFDASDVLSTAQRRIFRDLGCPFASIGRGEATA